MPPTPGPSHGSGRQVLPPVVRTIRVRTVGAAHPLPGVSHRVQYAIGACTPRIASHWHMGVERRTESRPGCIRRLVAPRIPPGIGPAGGLLPFRLGGEPFAEPRAVVAGPRPARLDHRVLLEARVGTPTSRPEMNACVRVVHVEEVLPSRIP